MKFQFAFLAVALVAATTSALPANSTSTAADIAIPTSLPHVAAAAAKRELYQFTDCNICSLTDTDCQAKCKVPTGPCNSGGRVHWPPWLKNKCFDLENKENSQGPVCCSQCPNRQDPGRCRTTCHKHC